MQALFAALTRSLGFACLLAVAGCQTLPQSGPDSAAIAAGAALILGPEDRAIGIDYVLVELDRTILAYFETAAPATLHGGFGAAPGGAPDVILGVGDVVEITVFEAAAGGLFIPDEAGSRPGNFITLPRQTVDRSGALTVPYAGRAAAAGRTPAAVGAEIEARLANRAIEPQVVVTVVESRSSRVSVLGDVNAPATLDINPAGERLLDAIARAGGVSTPSVETYVTLQRRGHDATVLFADLVNDPSENIHVAPGDTIYVNRERRTFLAFGASGRNGRFDFEESDLNLGEALAKAGGLLDSRADPSEVLIYRLVDRSVLEGFRANLEAFPDREIPVIFRANLRDPSAFFAVQRFAMEDGDVLYVSNADSVEIMKFLSLVNAATRTPAAVAGDVANTADAVGDIAD